MSIFQFISKELLIKSYYLAGSFILCALVNFYSISSWVFIFCLPVLEVQQETQFIFTEVDEAFGTTCLLMIYISLQMLLPFFFYQSLTFCAPALFQKEINFAKKASCTFLAANFFAHLVILKSFMQTLVHFFLQFQFELFNLPLVNFQAKIFSYITFVLTWCFIVQVFLFISCLSLFFFPKTLENLWLKRKSLLFFCSILGVSFILPPDGVVQLICTASTIVFLDCFGFFLFLRLKYQGKTQSRAFSLILVNGKI